MSRFITDATFINKICLGTGSIARARPAIPADSAQAAASIPTEPRNAAQMMAHLGAVKKPAAGHAPGSKPGRKHKRKE